MDLVLSLTSNQTDRTLHCKLSFQNKPCYRYHLSLLSINFSWKIALPYERSLTTNETRTPRFHWCTAILDFRNSLATQMWDDKWPQGGEQLSEQQKGRTLVLACFAAFCSRLSQNLSPYSQECMFAEQFHFSAEDVIKFLIISLSYHRM